MQAEITVFYDPKNALAIERLIRKLTYDDALVHRHYRLEYIRPLEGSPCYKLFRTETCIGMQFVKASWWLPEIQFRLAAYLTLIGFTPKNCRIETGGAKTPFDVKNYRLPKLFPVSFGDNELKEPEEDELDEVGVGTGFE